MDCNSCGYGEDTMMHARLCAKNRMPHVSQLRRDPTDAVGASGAKVTTSSVTKMPGHTPGVTSAVAGIVEVSVQHRCSECGEMHKRKLTAKEKKEAAAARKRAQRERES